MKARSRLSIPNDWPKLIHSALLDVASIAHAAIVYTRSWSADSSLQRVKLAGKLEQAEHECALLREEIRIKDIRLVKLPAHRRPFYPPTERLAILELKASRGWNLERTARAFLLEPQTIATWLARIDEQGDKALLQTSGPMNKLPDFVAHTVRRLKVLCPAMGKRRIADTLARAGLHLGATTVGRMLKRPLKPRPAPPFQPASLSLQPSDQVVTAREPNHVWHIDLTTVPTLCGFWIPWLPFSLPPNWPFAYRVAFVIDHFSRKCLGFRVFRKEPTSPEIRHFLGCTIRTVGKAPKHLISDQGSQFTANGFKTWCKRRKIKQRFGAVGHYGSIAIIERFIRSFKHECIAHVIVPFRIEEFRGQILAYSDWYNRHRPHQSLDGKTPEDVYSGATLSPPTLEIHGSQAVSVNLVVTHHRGQPHLPLVELRKAG